MTERCGWGFGARGGGGASRLQSKSLPPSTQSCRRGAEEKWSHMWSVAADEEQPDETVIVCASAEAELCVVF